MNKRTLLGVLLLTASIFTACSPKEDKNPIEIQEESSTQDRQIDEAVSPSLEQEETEIPKAGQVIESTSSEVTNTGGVLFNNIAQYPVVDGSTACLPLMSVVMQRTLGVSKEEAESLVSANKTTEAYYYLAEKYSDLLMVYEDSAENSQETKGLFQKAAIGQDALVFIVNKDNPVDNITSKQARDIYMGRIKNWKEVGGADVPIVAYQRNETAGSHVLLEKLVLDGIKPMKAPTRLVSIDMEGMIDVIADYENGEGAIGYSVYYFVHNMKKDPNIKMIAIDGVYPDNETIGLETYPYTNPFYVVVRADESKDSSAYKLYEWLQTDDGKQCIIDAGYVSKQEKSIGKRVWQP